MLPWMVGLAGTSYPDVIKVVTERHHASDCVERDHIKKLEVIDLGGRADLIRVELGFSGGGSVMDR